MNLKKIGKRLLFPPVWVMSILAVLSAVALAFVFIKKISQSPIAYASYIISFYTLTVICTFLSIVLPKRYKAIKQKIYSHPFGNKYMTDAAFRTHISLYFSLGINTLYAAVNILLFILYRSMWFVILAGYYILLAVMRFLLVRYARKIGIGKNKLSELKSTVSCSLILLTLNFVLSGAVLMMLYQNKGAKYHGILIYIMAAYTFYITTHAITDLVKYRKSGSPVITITKVIALSAALVSLLSLETAMLSQFGGNMPAQSKRLIIALTGAGVSITVIAMSVYMIIKSAKEIKKLKE